MVTALLAEGADPTWQSKSGETPLHVAVRYCHWEVADELLRFIASSKSTLDAIILVNVQNGVSNSKNSQSYHNTWPQQTGSTQWSNTTAGWCVWSN